MSYGILFEKMEGRIDYKGICPHPQCRKEIYKNQYVVDDTFGLTFECPHCHSLMFINSRGSSEVVLALPNEQEVIGNKFPEGTPTIENPGNILKRKVVW